MDTRPALSPASISELLALAEETRHWGCRILDLRPPPPSAANHLPGSACLPLGQAMDFAADLPAHMLPVTDSSLIVFDDEPERARAAAQYLLQRGHDARYFAGPAKELPLQAGPCRGALWSPDPYLQEQRALLPAPALGSVADLGAGNGRNAVFLAALGYRVHLYDRLPDALSLAQDRARRHGLEDRITIHQINLTSSARLPEAPFGLVLMVRFHEKTLMRGLRARLRPAGAVFVRTYASESSLDPGAPHAGPRRTRYRLAPEEVQRLFPASEWTFLARSSAFTRAEGPMIAFLASPRAD